MAKSQFLFLSLFLSFWFVGIRNLDPDFGWHWRTGVYILENGFPRTDPFSYTMPSYPFVPHSWGQDVIIAKLFPLISFSGLAAIYALMATLALWLVIPYRLRSWGTLPLLLAFMLILARFGIRTQVVSWVFFALFLRLYFSPTNYREYLKFSPPLMLFWANLHGGFILGLFLLTLATLLQTRYQKRIERRDLFFLSVAYLVTLLNPYTYHLWEISLKTLFFNENQKFIVEWRPFWYFTEPAFLYLVLFSSTLLFRRREILSLKMKVVYLIFLLAGLFSLRHGALFALVAVYPTSLVLKDLLANVSSSPVQAQRARTFLFLLWLSFLPVLGFSLKSLMPSSEQEFYPVTAVAWFQENPTPSNILSLHGWGGYLLWKLPQERVFADGRMDAWTRRSAPPGESLDAFAETLEIQKTGEFTEVFKKYGVHTVLWSRRIHDSVTNSEEDLFLEQLEKSSFKKVYEDEVAVIYTDEYSFRAITRTSLVLP